MECFKRMSRLNRLRQQWELCKVATQSHKEKLHRYIEPAGIVLPWIAGLLIGLSKGRRIARTNWNHLQSYWSWLLIWVGIQNPKVFLEFINLRLFFLWRGLLQKFFYCIGWPTIIFSPIFNNYIWCSWWFCTSNALTNTLPTLRLSIPNRNSLCWL